MLFEKQIRHHVGLLRESLPSVGYARAVDRLWIDDISPFWVWVASLYGLTKIRKRAGYVLFGSPHDMVGLTEKGLAFIAANAQEAT